jgi:hypothetical protein
VQKAMDGHQKAIEGQQKHQAAMKSQPETPPPE